MDTITNSERPKAASQAAKTNKIIGIILASVKWLLKIVIVNMTNRDSIMPSRQSKDDIKCDRYISNPTKEIAKARKMLMYTMDI